jgi:hypothetical protein
MHSYNNKIISIIAKNRLIVIKSVPQTGRYHDYPLTRLGLCLHHGPDSRPKPSMAIGLGRPEHASSRSGSCSCRTTTVPCHEPTIGLAYSARCIWTYIMLSRTKSWIHHIKHDSSSASSATTTTTLPHAIIATVIFGVRNYRK